MKKGVTLIECMIYILLVGFISVLVHQMVIKLIRLALSSNTHFTTLTGAYDILLHDLSRGLPTQKAWKMQGNQICFSTKKEMIKWRLANGTLLRTSHLYDKTHHKMKKATAVVAKGVTQFQCNLKTEKDKLVIEGSLSKNECNLPLYCLIRTAI